MGWIESYLNEHEPTADKKAQELFGLFVVLSGIYPTYEKKTQVVGDIILRVITCTFLLVAGCLFLETSRRAFPLSMMYLSLHYFLLMSLIGLLVPTYRVHRNTMTEIFLILHANVFSYSDSLMQVAQENNAQTVKTIVRLVKYFSLLLVALAFVAIFCLIVVLRLIFPPTPEEAALAEVDVCIDLPIPLYSPYGCESWISWTVLLLLQCYCGYAVCITVFAATLLHLIVFTNVYKSFELVKYGLENIHKRIKSRIEECPLDKKNTDGRDHDESKYYWEHYRLCLRESIMHYQETRRLFMTFTDIIKFPLFCVLMTSSLILAFAGIQFTLNDMSYSILVSSALLCGIEIVHMLIYCYTGEYANTLNNEVQLSFYDIDWYNFESRMKMEVLISMRVGMSEIAIETLWGVKANLDTFATIVNTAYSYVNLLLAFK